ncbi:hypothetical protein [Nostoc sp.]|uniref:hypothetical protein n=1 Tax=Nostoc sp. TaxID=1180 RepID=UPI002FF6BEAD
MTITISKQLVRLVVEEIDNTGKWGKKNRAEVVKLIIPHLKIDAKKVIPKPISIKEAMLTTEQLQLSHQKPSVRNSTRR